jgi:hypothetical protein
LSLVSWSIKVSGRPLILFVSIILILIIPVVLVILVSHLRTVLLVFKPLILRGYFFCELRPSRSSLPVVVRKHPLKPHGFLLGLHETAIEGVAILGLTQNPLVPAICIVVVARAIPTELPLLAVLVVRNRVEDTVIFKFILLVVRRDRTLLDPPPIRVDKRVKRLGTLLP